MATIIITLILNLLVGTPGEIDNQNLNSTATNDTEMMSTMGGSGAWVNIDREP